MSHSRLKLLTFLPLVLSCFVLVFSVAEISFAEGTIKKENRFNRLFKGAANFNLPPTKDGIHDGENPGTEMLQTPKEAFSTLPKSKAGNRVNWVKALEEGHISPRADRLDDEKKMTVLNLNIVREVKGSMPDVVYPHKQHTEWLQCSNCHPKIFIPKKGANKISMAGILGGQYCGVCHGKVAFPVSECRMCHSKNKTKEQIAERTKRVGGKAVVKVVSEKAERERSKGKLGDMNRASLLSLGKNVYEDTCQGCHGENGEGVPGTFPALQGSKIVDNSKSADEHIKVVVEGRKDTSMQPWAKELTAQEIAAVITYERLSWGNKGGVVQPKQVQKVIDASKAK